MCSSKVMNTLRVRPRFLLLLPAVIFLLLFYIFASPRQNVTNDSPLAVSQLTGDAYCGDEKMQFVSYLRGKEVSSGRKFRCSLVKVLDEFGLSSSFHYGNNVTFSSDEVVFVTYSSSNHFSEARRALLHLRNQTNNRIIFYDLGLTESEIGELGKVCNLEVRKLNFDRYPPFARKLFSYQFKPIVIAEVFASLKAFWVIDTSVRFFGSTKSFYEKVSDGRIESFVLRHPSSHSIFAATQPRMYQFLPIEEGLAKSEEMLDANTMFVKKSDFSREAVKWNLLCALTDGCMNPVGAMLGCNFKEDRHNFYANCHRYDQSCINIIVTNMFEREDIFPRRDRMKDDLSDVNSVDRGQASMDPLNIPCRVDVFV